MGMKTIRVRSLKAVLDTKAKNVAPMVADHIMGLHLEPVERNAAVTITTSGNMKFEKVVK